MHRLLIWIKATRPQFLTAIILPILLGTAIAWHTHHVFFPSYLGLALLLGIFSHLATNVLNDYFDHIHNTDEVNLTPLTPFAGGSRMIQKGLLSAEQTYRYGMLLLFISVLIAFVLVWLRGSYLLVIIAIGFLSGYGYSAPPLSLNRRGLGEITVGLNFGFLVVLGAYFVQTQSIAILLVAFAALPLVWLMAALLYINEFPDFQADQQTGKNTLVVRLGLARARWVYHLLIGLAFASLILSVILGYLPLLSLLVLLTLPLGLRAIKTLHMYYDTSQALVPAIQKTIMLHVLVGSLLSIAFVLSP